MTPEQLIEKGINACNRLCADKNNQSVSDWLIYGSVLSYGKSISKGCVAYGIWIKQNSLARIDSPMRSFALRLYKLWPEIEPHTDIGGELEGVTDPQLLTYIYERKIKRGQQVNPPPAPMPIYEYVRVNGANVSVVTKAIKRIVDLAEISENDDFSNELIKIAESLANEVISSIKTDKIAEQQRL